MSQLDAFMLDHCPSMMLLVEPENLRIVHANRVATRTLGYSLEALRELAITDVESSLQDVFYWEDVRHGQRLEIEGQEGLYRRADGSLLSVSKSVLAMDLEDGPRMLVLARDIDEERRIEKDLEQTLSQLRATLESTGNGILVIDWQGRLASMNRLLSQMWNLPEDSLLERRDEAILDSLLDAVVEREPLRARLSAILGHEETAEIYHLKDGRIFECRSRPQYLGERIVGRVFSFDDITEAKHAEAALRESRDQLEQRVRERTADLLAANARLEVKKQHQDELIRKLEAAQNQLLQSEKLASIGQLAAGVAHEINNPVGFVNSNLNTLQRYVRDMLRLLDAYESLERSSSEVDLEPVRQVKKEIDADFLREDIGHLLDDSLDGLRRVKSIVQDLKNFSHVDRAELEWADIEAGLDSTLNVVWNELKYKARVIKEYAGAPQIRCLPSQLNQVFMNLLINAAHAIEGQGEIVIRTGFDDDQLWVEVSDTGKGIPSEHLKRIFEPFFTTKPVGKGTGLGLSLAYGIVSKHGGRIEVSSEVGRGSTFRVILPRNPDFGPRGGE